MRGKSKKILIGMAVVFVLLILMYAVSLARSKGRLRAAYAALEQDGRPMDANEVLPPEVPDAQNAAVLYERAVALVKAESVDDKDLLEYLGKLSSAFLNDSVDPNQEAELQQRIEQEAVTAALSAMEEALQRPSCRFSRAEGVASQVELPISEDVRNLAIILNARAYLAAKAGRSHEAWEMMDLQLRSVEKLRLDPAALGAWVQFHLIGHACRVVRKLSEIAPPDEQEYRTLETRLWNLDAIEPFIRTIDVERLLVGEPIFSLPEDQLYAWWRDVPWADSEGGPDSLHRLFFRFVTYRPRFIADHASYLQVSRKTIHLLEGPYMSHESMAFQEVRDLAFRYPLTSRLGIMGTAIKSIHCRMAGDVRVTRAGLALLQHKQAHGAFPATLEALGLEGLIDPYNEEPLHYRAEGDGFIVYSVGGDLKDNDGLLEQPRRSSDPRAKKKDREHDRGWRFAPSQADAET
jgi:hypothetical protein